MSERVSKVKITRVGGDSTTLDDLVVIEEPLEIRIGFGLESNRKQHTISVTMRTPGDDEQLCLGFLYTENIISSASDVMSAKYCSNTFEEDGGNNVMRVELKPGVQPVLESINRNFYMNSSCGVCGKASINHIKTQSESIIDTGLRLEKDILLNLPNTLEETQTVFKHTGGLHACGIFDKNGKLILHKEDVGRHNALDKAIGTLLLNKLLPASDSILMLSGRISFELVQKAVKAGILIVAAVGAPSSLSISLADEFGITLIGFLKEKGFNIYTGSHRIID